MTLPEEHLLCMGCAAKTFSEQADCLARLHSAVRSGKPAQILSFDPLLGREQSLQLHAWSPSPEGG